jgi:hypothetical protein
MKNKHLQWVSVLKTMLNKSYWSKANTIEFIAFVIRALIIIPGLLFDLQIWWLYIFAVLTSLALIWSSTVKTLPTLIWFNIVWIFLGTFAIIKHFLK